MPRDRVTGAVATDVMKATDCGRMVVTNADPNLEQLVLGNLVDLNDRKEIAEFGCLGRGGDYIL